MTLVIARQWNDRIIMLADTMISDAEQPRHDIIPGKLKVIVLTPKLSIAYAGRSNPALDAVREAWRMAYQATDLQGILEYLRHTTSSWDVDFLVASHYAEPILYKISSGKIVQGASWYYIGDQCAASAVQSAMEAHPSRAFGEKQPDEEASLAYAFTEVIRGSIFPGVGGFSFYLLGSSWGHCYQDIVGSFAWDTVKLSDIDTPDYRHFKKTGTAHYEYSILSPKRRGVGVAGAFLPQAELGFIYSPLQWDKVCRCSGVTLQDFSAEVNQIATDLICLSEK